MTFSLLVLTFVDIAVLVDGAALAMRLSAYHLALILSAILGYTRSQCNLLGHDCSGYYQ